MDHGGEKFYGAPAWMRHLIDHLLAPDALTRDSTNPLLAAFSFDHVTDGMIAASQRDTGELYAIHVEDTMVTTELLWIPRMLRDDGLLPYEVALDVHQTTQVPLAGLSLPRVPVEQRRQLGEDEGVRPALACRERRRS